MGKETVFKNGFLVFKLLSFSLKDLESFQVFVLPDCQILRESTMRIGISHHLV